MLIFEWLKIVLVFIVMVSVLVAAHEFGHYLFARIFKMGVHEFAIGFGKKPIWVWMRRRHRIPLSKAESDAILQAERAVGAEAPVPDETSRLRKAVFEFEGSANAKEEIIRDANGVPVALEEETQYTVRPWPLGGFVKIKAMMPEDDGSEVHVPAGFYSRAPWKRFIVLLAGPVFSILAGMVILFGLYLTNGVVRQTNIVETVVRDGPADKAGIKPGDKIVAVDGTATPTFYDVVVRVRDAAGKDLHLTVARDQQTLNIDAVPVLDTNATDVLGPDLYPTGQLRRQAKLMASFSHIFVPVGVGEAFTQSAHVPVEVVSGLVKLARRQVSVKDSVGGPIAVIGMTKSATDEGVTSIIFLAGMLSISVGIFNLLPIHPLDGGQMVVAFAEMLRGGRRLSINVQSALASAGMAVLLLMVVGILFIDVNRYVHPDKPKAAAVTK